jgi:hypothetical protein
MGTEMNLVYVLFVIIQGAAFASISVTTAEFSDKDKCEIAAKSVQEHWKDSKVWCEKK